MNDGKFRLPAGKFKGVLITRVPPGYLRWMISTGHSYTNKARAELHRRGTVEPNIEVTAHAIDRASTRLLGMFTLEAKPNEGLHSWLSRTAEEALDQASEPMCDNYKVSYRDVIFVFDMKFVVPVLKSVWHHGEEE